MAYFRHVYCSFWKDYKVLELFSPQERLLFLFLLTNENTRQVGIYKILIKEIAFLLGFTEELITEMMNKFENKYNIIHYNNKTHEIAIVHWAKYNLNKSGGKPVLDCIRKELKEVEDTYLLEVIMKHITKDEIKNLYIEAIAERENRLREESLANSEGKLRIIKKGEVDENDFTTYSKCQSTSKSKKEDDPLYEKPSEEQLRRVKELYN